MTGQAKARLSRRSVVFLVPVIGLTGAMGCSARANLEVATPQQLSTEVRDVLGNDWRSAEYHQRRTQLQEMGPEVDSVLVNLIEDDRARIEARADALVLLADRRSPLALPTFERALQYDNARLRSAAVVGLGRLADASNLARSLIRGATTDRSRTVRLSALQSLDVSDVETIRLVLEREGDPEVREVGLQLLLLAESRGAPLAADARGALRTTVGRGEPQIVFRPVVADSTTQVARGDLRVELPDGADIPLAASATVVSNVVPAFFSPDRGAVVVEDNGEIRIVDLSSRSGRSLGQGLAPRPIPFTYEFVYVVERMESRSGGPVEAGIVYEVYRSSFAPGPIELLGELTARLRSDRHGGHSPIRWMVVDETGDGFVLRGENLETFPLPTPVWGPGRPNGSVQGGVPR